MHIIPSLVCYEKQIDLSQWRTQGGGQRSFATPNFCNTFFFSPTTLLNPFIPKTLPYIFIIDTKRNVYIQEDQEQLCLQEDQEQLCFFQELFYICRHSLDSNTGLLLFVPKMVRKRTGSIHSHFVAAAI